MKWYDIEMPWSLRLTYVLHGHDFGTVGNYLERIRCIFLLIEIGRRDKSESSSAKRFIAYSFLPFNSYNVGSRSHDVAWHAIAANNTKSPAPAYFL